MQAIKFHVIPFLEAEARQIPLSERKEESQILSTPDVKGKSRLSFSSLSRIDVF